jgi:hypothetical protein
MSIRISLTHDAPEPQKSKLHIAETHRKEEVLQLLLRVNRCLEEIFIIFTSGCRKFFCSHVSFEEITKSLFYEQ